MSAVNATSPQQPDQTAPEARSSEPSMEDILASIRRIISDDQSRSAVTTGAANRRVAAPMPAYVPAPPVEHRPAPTGFEVEAPAIDMAQPLAPTPVAEPEPARPAEAKADAELPPHLNPPIEEPRHDYAHDPAVIEEIANAGVASILRPRAVAPVAIEEPAPEPDPAAAEAEDAAEWSEVAEEPEPLISEQVGASVNSSFQALATTVLMQHSDMIEPMMRELLRPLLKSWLDDNLPTIVERLVRGEIERVARGGRN